jgi:hypothetical protein
MSGRGCRRRLPAALASAGDAATLIHAQAFKASQTGEFVPVTQTAGDLYKRTGVRMVSAVLAGYGEKLDAAPDTYKAFLRLLHASMRYAVEHPDEVFPAVAKNRHRPRLLCSRFTRFDFPVLAKDTSRPSTSCEAGNRLDILNGAARAGTVEARDQE